MFSICLCDDNQCFLSSIENEITDILNSRSISFCIEKYDDPTKLLDVIRKNVEQYDLYVLDMEMEKLHGMVLLQDIRGLDKNRCVIVITSHMQYSYEGYDYNLTSFIHKDHIEKSTRLEMAILSAFERSEKSDFVIKANKFTRVINYADISYIKKVQKYIEYHLCDGSVIAVRQTLKELSDSLPSKLFVYANRGTIINIMKVYTVDKSTIILNDGSSLRATDSYLKNIITVFSNYWSEMGAI